MAITLTLEQSLMLTTGEWQKGVIETEGLEFKILQRLPMMAIKGNTHIWNVETALPEEQFRAVGEAITPGKIEFEQQTASLKILGDEVIVDTFDMQTGSDVVDQMAWETTAKAKAMMYKFETSLLHGDIDNEPSGFNGLSKLVAPSQIVKATGSLVDDVDELIDMIEGSPDVLIMSKSTRRLLVSQNRSYITYTQNKFGAQLIWYGGDIEILDVEDNLLEFGKVYAVKFGEGTGVCGITNGGIQIRPIGEMETRPALMTRLEWFCGLAVFNHKCLAVRQ